jgi:hypothetical protein
MCSRLSSVLFAIIVSVGSSAFAGQVVAFAQVKVVNPLSVSTSATSHLLNLTSSTDIKTEILINSSQNSLQLNVRADLNDIAFKSADNKTIQLKSNSTLQVLDQAASQRIIVTMNFQPSSSGFKQTAYMGSYNVGIDY